MPRVSANHSSEVQQGQKLQCIAACFRIARSEKSRWTSEVQFELLKLGQWAIWPYKFSLSHGPTVLEAAATPVAQARKTAAVSLILQVSPTVPVGPAITISTMLSRSKPGAQCGIQQPPVRPRLSSNHFCGWHGSPGTLNVGNSLLLLGWTDIIKPPL